MFSSRDGKPLTGADLQKAFGETKAQEPAVKATATKSAKAPVKESPKSDDPSVMSTAELKAAKAELQGKLAAVQAELAKRTSAEKAGKPKAEPKPAKAPEEHTAATKEVLAGYEHMGRRSSTDADREALFAKVDALSPKELKQVAPTMGAVGFGPAKTRSEIKRAIIERQGMRRRIEY